MLRSRRAGLVAVFILIVGYLTLFQDWSKVRPVSTSGAAHRASQPSRAPDTSNVVAAPWTFSAARDRDNHALTAEQCSAEFPDLYHEIDRSAKYWTKRQGGKKLGIDQWGLDWSGDGGLRVMIHNQQLFITHSRGLNHFQHWKERSLATLHQIHRAILASREPVPDIEFSIKINDKIGLERRFADKTVWGFSRNISDRAMDQMWIIPDFNFWSYPRVAGAFGNFQQEGGVEIGNDFDGKLDLLVWRGTTDFNPEVREALIAQANGMPWSDVHKVREDAIDDNRITMPDHCRYKYAVHTEGTTWSGRLKYLLSCHSVIFAHTLTHYTHLYHLLEPSGPSQNIVSVSKDWVDLPDKMNDLLVNPDKARMIADNAASKFRDRYFTPAAQTCYWRKLFHVWSQVATFPDPYEHWIRPDGSKESVLRGMTYEEYV